MRVPRILVPLLGLLAGAACAQRLARAPEVPDAADFHRHVLAVVATYPTDGTHRYFWPKEGAWKGNVRTLTYAGEVIAPGDPEGRCHCCGLTFEVFLQAWQRWCAETSRPFRIRDLDAEGVRTLQREWFGSAEDRSCLHTAVVKNGLGRRIERLEDARAGDFVQLWRRSGSGHSVVFLRWERAGGAVAGITYWSTQGATDGIGERTEPIGEGPGDVDASRMWICRIGN